MIRKGRFKLEVVQGGASRMVREGSVFSETSVSSYPRGAKDEQWWLAFQVHLKRHGGRRACLKAGVGREQT